jgi:antitoxin HicB
MNYDIVIVKLSEKDGGGFLGYVPDLPGCMSDGETRMEALVNTELAIKEWVDAAKKVKKPIPSVGTVKRQALKMRAVVQKTIDETRQIIEKVESVDSKIEKLVADVKDLQETHAHHEAWDRFAGIVNFPIVDPKISKRKRVSEVH